MEDIKQQMIESLRDLREKATELVGVITSYENSQKKTVLRTIRTLTSALGHAGKDFRAVSVEYEKSIKA